MAINQTPGEIYFITEEDLLTHDVSSYVKVGLVRENEGRSSEERLLEHQTGNPRKLSIYKKISTPAVSAIEGVLHGLFAANRVSGEWFDFDGATLERCVQEAEKLKLEAEANIEIIAEAARLKDVPSTDEIKKPTKLIQDFFSEYTEATACLSECKSQDKAIRELFILAETGAEDVGHLIEKQERKGRTILNKELLESTHPDIYSKYISSEVSISGRVSFVKVDVLEISMRLLGDGADDFMQDLRSVIELVAAGTAPVDHLQDYSLRLAEFTTAAEWHQEIALANIKAFCGTASEIEGILKWARVKNSKEVFNEKLFKEEQPELYAKFSSTGDDVVAHKVKMTKANPKKGSSI
jgi:hypothetical protein